MIIIIIIGRNYALDLAKDLRAIFKEVKVFADNQAALLRLKTPLDNPGQTCLLRSIKAARLLRKKGVKTLSNWVPSHQDILGNEKADSLAKEVTKENPYQEITSLAIIGTHLK